MVSHVVAMRISHDAEMSEDIGFEADSDPIAFTCPSQCLECCSKLRSITGLVGGYMPRRNAFKCITRSHDLHAWAPDGIHECDAPTNRTDSHPNEMKRTCHFTTEERRNRAHQLLERCRDNSVSTFADFIGPSSCSFTGVGRAISSATGHHFGALTIADLAILRPDGPIMGGASGHIAGKLAEDNMLPPTRWGEGTQTQEEFQQEVADRFTVDLAQKRLNPFSMAAWAGGMGALTEMNLTRAYVGTRILRKVEIAGWPTRLVATETLEDDMGQINLQGGIIPCATERMRGLPMEDNMNDNENQWGQGMEDPTVLNEWYFNRFGVYQTPFHFDFPLNEMTSDRILEQLVFQNIGAHDLEMIRDIDGHDAVSVSPVGLGGCPSGALPVRGCPHPIHGALAALPEQVRRTIKFTVRMEGLFEDVPLRPGMAQWGGNAFFDGEGHLRALQYDGQTLIAGDGSRDWEYFKFVFRSSLISKVTAFDHLVVTHIIYSETLAMAVTENLGPDNELRMFLNPHILGTLKVNMGASNNLFPSNSLVHRASPFDEEAYMAPDGRSNGILWGKTVALRFTRFQEAYRTYRQFFEELRSEGVQMPELPFFEDGVQIHREIQRYVESAIAGIYGSGDQRCSAALLDDHEAQRFLRQFWRLSDPSTPDFWPSEFRHPTCNALTELLTELIFGVTGWHRHVGSVADFFRDTRFASTLWKRGEMTTRPAQAVIVMLLAQTTNAVLPKMIDDVSETIYGSDHESLTQNFRTFTRHMHEIQSDIEQKNQVRQMRNDIPYHNMEPTSVEWSVAV